MFCSVRHNNEHTLHKGNHWKTKKKKKEKMTALQLSGEMWFSLIQHEVRDDGWRERATTKRSRDIRIGQRDHPLVIHLDLS